VWTPGNDAVGQRVSGDVVWDGDTQRGYMRFTNLPKNNRAIEQYQLWIFDASRDERYPVDGGVFDVSADANGNVVVPIRARLQVRTPTMFAVTIERPGGVVVSDRSRIVAIAKI
jgi:anti-sigma-K factor RskA